MEEWEWEPGGSHYQRSSMRISARFRLQSLLEDGSLCPSAQRRGATLAISGSPACVVDADLIAAVCFIFRHSDGGAAAAGRELTLGLQSHQAAVPLHGGAPRAPRLTSRFRFDVAGARACSAERLQLSSAWQGPWGLQSAPVGEADFRVVGSTSWILPAAWEFSANDVLPRDWSRTGSSSAATRLAQHQARSRWLCSSWSNRAGCPLQEHFPTSPACFHAPPTRRWRLGARCAGKEAKMQEVPCLRCECQPSKAPVRRVAELGLQTPERSLQSQAKAPSKL